MTPMCVPSGNLTSAYHWYGRVDLREKYPPLCAPRRQSKTLIPRECPGSRRQTTLIQIDLTTL